MTSSLSGQRARLPSKEKCPQRGSHTEGPDDYRAWHDWACRMAATHHQEQCPGCGLWLIWTPKNDTTEAAA